MTSNLMVLALLVYWLILTHAAQVVTHAHIITMYSYGTAQWLNAILNLNKYITLKPTYLLVKLIVQYLVTVKDAGLKMLLKIP